MRGVIIPELNQLEASEANYYVTGRMMRTNSEGRYSGLHTLNIRGAASSSEINVRDTSSANRTSTNGHINGLPLGAPIPEPIGSIHIFSVRR
jgi:hypothetical protein